MRWQLLDVTSNKQTTQNVIILLLDTRSQMLYSITQQCTVVAMHTMRFYMTKKNVHKRKG